MFPLGDLYGRQPDLQGYAGVLAVLSARSHLVDILADRCAGLARSQHVKPHATHIPVWANGLG